MSSLADTSVLLSGLKAREKTNVLRVVGLERRNRMEKGMGMDKEDRKVIKLLKEVNRDHKARKRVLCVVEKENSARIHLTCVTRQECGLLVEVLEWALELLNSGVLRSKS